MGASGSAGSTRRAVLRTLLAFGAGTLTGVATHGFAYERHRLEVTPEELLVAGLPDALAGLRIALLTDLHRSETVPGSDVDRAVEVAQSQRPDLILLGGDYVTWGDRSFVGDVTERLGRLSAPHGVFAVLGNHDDERHVPAGLARQGIELLRDARTRVTIRGAALDLVGVRFWTRKPDDIARLVGSHPRFTILLAHDPRRLRQAAALDLPLVLSGHTHGGQVLLPGFGAISGRKFPVLSGMARDRRTTLFVSRGIGTVYLPLRINCPPEVAVLTLRGERADQ